jgi:hypothetical protein
MEPPASSVKAESRLMAITPVARLKDRALRPECPK